jgi:hypothetical protein
MLREMLLLLVAILLLGAPAAAAQMSAPATVQVRAVAHIPVIARLDRIDASEVRREAGGGELSQDVDVWVSANSPWRIEVEWVEGEVDAGIEWSVQISDRTPERGVLREKGSPGSLLARGRPGGAQQVRIRYAWRARPGEKDPAPPRIAYRLTVAPAPGSDE